MKISKISKVIAVAMIILMSMIAFAGCGKKNEVEKDNAYLEPLETFFSGVKEKDIEKALQAFPDFMNMGSLLTSDDIDIWYKNYENEYGSNITMDYSFGEAIRYEGKELDEFKAELAAAYDNVNKDDVKDAYFVPVTITVKGDGLNPEDGEESSPSTGKDQVNYYAFKYKDSWYIR